METDPEIRQVIIAYRIIDFYQKNNRLPNKNSEHLTEVNLGRYLEKFMIAEKNNTNSYLRARNVINNFFEIN